MDNPITLETFMREMEYDFMGNVYGDGKKNLKGDTVKIPNEEWGHWGHWKNWSNAQWQPHGLIFGVPLPEPAYYTIVDFMCGTGGLWWDYTKVREGIAAAPTSRLHGDMLGKQSFQRKDAKEMLATVQTMKTVILNLESDLEKIKEQRNAFFANKGKGNPEQIKGLFVDNFGGPSRSWSALAREVPIVRSALTWFYRLEEKTPEDLKMKKGGDESEAGFKARWATECQKDMETQAEEFVAKEELNPAVSNYLKRKVQEYWTWRNDYKTFIDRTYNSIVENLRQQRANLQLYVRWAERNIQEAENMLLPYAEVSEKFALFAEEFPQFAPLAYTDTEMFYDPEKKWPIVMSRLKPWIPCIGIDLMMAYNPDLQGNKFVRGFNIMTYGVMRSRKLNELKEKWEGQKRGFVKLMKDSANISDDEMISMGLAETKDEKNTEEYRRLKADLKKVFGDNIPDDKEKAMQSINSFEATKEDREKLAEEYNKMKKLAQELLLEESDKGKSEKEIKSSIMGELEEWFNKPGAKKDKSMYYRDWSMTSNLLGALTPFLKFFGNDLNSSKSLDTRMRRASWFSFNTFFKAYHGIKAGMGWMDYQ